jgi:hypothetical protein
MLSDELTIMGSFPDAYQVALWQNISVTAWFGRATLPAAQELSRIVARTALLTTGQRVSVIYLVAEEFGLPDSDVRDVLLNIMKDNAHLVGCIAVILGGTGFWVSAMRGVVTGLRVVAPSALDVRVHGKAEELLGWFPAEHLKRTGVQLDLVAFGRMLKSVATTQEQGRAQLGRS